MQIENAGGGVDAEMKVKGARRIADSKRRGGADGKRLGEEGWMIEIAD